MAPLTPARRKVLLSLRKTAFADLREDIGASRVYSTQQIKDRLKYVRAFRKQVFNMGPESKEK